MWCRVVTKGFGALVAALCISAPARAADGAGPFIWYRSAEGCPDGDAFLNRLRARGVEGHMARVGDPVDFVVTLGSGQEGAQGLLERQTATGTVAVRELDGTDCEQVADGIALVLAMARESTPERPPSPREEARAKPSPASVLQAPPARPVKERGASSRRVVWAVGAQGGWIVGVTPAVLAEAAAFVELALGEFLRTASFRAYAFGGVGSNSELSTFILAGRMEGCPLAVSAGAFAAMPCVGLDLGTLNADGSGPKALKDHGFWAAAEISARASLTVAGPLSFEAQVGALIPFQHYQLTSEGSTTPLYASSPVGLNAAFGVRIRLP